MDTTKTITHVSLCAGYGGIDLGLGRAIQNLRTIAFSEIEAFACANLVSKMEAGLLDAAPIWTDLKTFPWSDFRDRVDILSGGYPCQPFSAAGKRLGTEDPRHLWPFIADGIRAMRPRICFFENVEGHISLGLREVISELESLGYTTTWGIFSAREVGAPHQRKRVFILAYRNGEGSQRAICEGIQRASRKPFGHNDDVLAYSNNGRGREDKLLSELRATGIEQSSRCSRLPSESIQVGKITIWPSRPGEQQHGWEPPRVVGNTIVHGHSAAQISGGPSQSKTEGRMQESEGGSSSMGDSEGWSNGQQPTEQQGRDTPGRSGEESGAMGDTEHDGLPTESIIRGDETTGDERRAQESNQARQLTGADRPSDVPSIQGSTSRSESMGDFTEQGCEGSGRQDDSGRSIFRSSKSDGSSSNRPMESAEWQAQPSLGGDADGITDWMDNAELCVTYDNRTDELRLLGNGVVPATANRAFRVLMDQLNEN